jgi:site-specific recombinase XerD
MREWDERAARPQAEREIQPKIASSYPAVPHSETCARAQNPGSRKGRVGSIPAPDTILARAQFVPRPTLRRAAFGASRLGLPGHDPRPRHNQDNDSKGKLRKTDNWYIEFVAGNRTMREATEFTERSDGAEFLKLRISDALGGKIVLSKNVTYDDLCDVIITDYHEQRSEESRRSQEYEAAAAGCVFGDTKAIDIKTASVERYKTLRLKDGAAPATVNRELAALKRMFRLGLRQGMVATMPYISMLAEHNVRKGFFELDQFQAILKHLPTEYHTLFELAYITGWRMRSELLTRQWRHVDFAGKGWLRVDPGEAKDATAGREFQFTSWIRDALERQRKFVSKVEKRTKAVIRWVFCRADGVRIHRFYGAWRDACMAAGIQRIPHDFRTTAVRNLERAGVPRTTEMAMIGHKTESIYRRYNIVDQAMLEMGTLKLDALQKSQKGEKATLVSMKRRALTESTG